MPDWPPKLFSASQFQHLERKIFGSRESRPLSLTDQTSLQGENLFKGQVDVVRDEGDGSLWVIHFI
jgi:hypothetical protein